MSHIHQASEIAVLISDAIQDYFYGYVQIFNSSDGTSLVSGDDFIAEIDTALRDCSLGLFLVSPHSVNAKWINLEYGAIKMRNLLNPAEKILLVPLCHSGMDHRHVGQPLDSRSAVIAGNGVQLTKLFEDIAGFIGWKKPILSQQPLADQVLEKEAKQKANVDLAKPIQELQHINLVVSDLKRSVDFYADILAMQLVKRPPFKFGGAWFQLPNGQHLHLVEKNDMTPLNYQLPKRKEDTVLPCIHFAFRLDHDRFHQLTAKTMLALAEDRYIDQPFGVPIRQCYVLDPDGHMFEFTDITEMQKYPGDIGRDDWEDYAYWWLKS